MVTLFRRARLSAPTVATRVPSPSKIRALEGMLSTVATTDDGSGSAEWHRALHAQPHIGERIDDELHAALG